MEFVAVLLARTQLEAELGARSSDYQFQSLIGVRFPGCGGAGGLRKFWGPQIVGLSSTCQNFSENAF